jgi:hypothetical protein
MTYMRLLALWMPIPALAEVQVALEQAVSEVTGLAGFELKRVMRTGTVASADNRNINFVIYNFSGTRSHFGFSAFAKSLDRFGDALPAPAWRLPPAAFKSLISCNRCLSSANICSAGRRLRAGLPALILWRAEGFGLRVCCTGRRS